MYRGLAASSFRRTRIQPARTSWGPASSEDFSRLSRAERRRTPCRAPRRPREKRARSCRPGVGVFHLYFFGCVGMCGYVWVCVGMWVFVGMCGYVWVCVGMCGYAWVCVGICGYVWVCVGMCGHVVLQKPEIWDARRPPLG